MKVGDGQFDVMSPEDIARIVYAWNSEAGLDWDKDILEFLILKLNNRVDELSRAMEQRNG